MKINDWRLYSSLVRVSSLTRLGEVDIVCPELTRIVQVRSSVPDRHQKSSNWIIIFIRSHLGKSNNGLLETFRRQSEWNVTIYQRQLVFTRSLDFKKSAELVPVLFIYVVLLGAQLSLGVQTSSSHQTCAVWEVPQLLEVWKRCEEREHPASVARTRPPKHAGEHLIKKNFHLA